MLSIGKSDFNVKIRISDFAAEKSVLEVDFKIQPQISWISFIYVLWEMQTCSREQRSCGLLIMR